MSRDMLLNVVGAAMEGAVACAVAAVAGYILWGDPSRVGMVYLFTIVAIGAYRRLALSSTINRTVISIRRTITEPRR